MTRKVYTRNPMSKEQLEEAARLYVEGLSTYMLAPKYGLSAELLRLALRKAGVQMRSGAEAQRENRKGA